MLSYLRSNSPLCVLDCTEGRGDVWGVCFALSKDLTKSRIVIFGSHNLVQEFNRTTNS